MVRKPHEWLRDARNIFTIHEIKGVIFDLFGDFKRLSDASLTHTFRHFLSKGVSFEI